MRITSALLALVMVLSAVMFCGCSKKDEPVKSKPTNVFKAEYINLPDELNNEENIWNCYYGSEKIYFPVQKYNDNGEEFTLWMFDIETGNCEKFCSIESSYEDNGGTYLNDCVVLADDSVLLFLYEYSYNEETDEYTNNSPIRHYTAPDKYDEVDFASIIDKYNGETSDDAYHYYYNVKSLPGGDICLTDGNSQGIYIIRNFNEVVASINTGNNVNYENISIMKDGRAVVSYYDNTDYKDTMSYIDLNTCELGSKFDTTGLGTYIYNLITPPSDSKYDFYFTTGYQVCGYTAADGSSAVLCDWLNSDININNVGNYRIVSDDRILMYVNGTERKVGVLTRVPDDEVKEKYIITYAGEYINYNFVNTILRFNQENPDYRITIKDYSLYNTEDDYELGSTKLSNDIISGNVPDIIQLSAEMPVSSYTSKGLFADLYKFMDSDENFSRDDYLSNIFDAFSTDGKLYQLVPFFSVQTMTAKKSLVGDADHITPEQMIDIIKAHPNARVFEDMTRANFLSMILENNIGSYIDEATGVCRFDTDEFIRILELCSLLPEKSIYDDMNWEEVDNSFWTELQLGLRKDTTLFYYTYLSNYRTYWEMLKGTFGTDINMVGYPSEGGNGSSINATVRLAMSAKSSMKEGIWEFFKYILSEDLFTTDNDYMWYVFPVNLKALDRLAQEDMKKNSYINVMGEEEVMPTTWWAGDEEIEIGEIDRENVEKVNDFLRSLKNTMQYDNELMEIINEEASAFFAGAKTAAEAASLIQNRASIFVNERR